MVARLRAWISTHSHQPTQPTNTNCTIIACLPTQSYSPAVGERSHPGRTGGRTLAEAENPRTSHSLGLWTHPTTRQLRHGGLCWSLWINGRWLYLIHQTFGGKPRQVAVSDVTCDRYPPPAGCMPHCMTAPSARGRVWWTTLWETQWGQMDSVIDLW